MSGTRLFIILHEVSFIAYKAVITLVNHWQKQPKPDSQTKNKRAHRGRKRRLLLFTKICAAGSGLAWAGGAGVGAT